MTSPRNMGRPAVNRLTVTNGTSFVTRANDTYVGKSLEVYGEWSQGELALLAQVLQPGSNVVEAGANIGAHTVFLGRDLCPEGRIYAFEPRRLVFQMLCANLALNSVTNVHAFQQALGAEEGEVREGALPLDAANVGAIALGALPGGEERFEVVALDRHLATLPHIALLKADVEGHELKVLLGAAGLIARDRPLMYLENDRPDLSEALVRHVQGLGYALWWHIVPLFRPDNPAGTRVDIFGNVHSFNMFCAPRERGVTVDGLPAVEDAAAHPLAGR